MKPADLRRMLDGAELATRRDRPSTGDQPPPLSVIVPTLNEAATVGQLLSDLTGLEVEHEVVVVDGQSIDATRAIAAAGGARVINSAPGRGVQLRAGAAAAGGRLLCFLHADARLDRNAVDMLSNLADRRPHGAFAFRLRIDDDRFWFRIIELGANLRSRYLRLPYGDQGLIVHREDYLRAGGYPSHPLMEDLALVRALRKATRIVLLDAEVRVSARRWLRDGVFRRTLRNQMLLLRYLGGASPERLALAYRAEKGREGPPAPGAPHD